MKTKLPPRASIFIILTLICIVALFVILLKQRTDLAQIKKEYGQLREQNAGLQKNLALSPAQPSPLSVAPAQAQPPQTTPLPKPLPEAEPNKLTLTSTLITATPNGLVATLHFTPGKTGPLGLFALAIRMPKNSNARILGLEPVGPATYSDSSKELSADGKFAFCQGTLGDEKDVQVALSVSGPTTVSVRGTCGIKPFELAIQAPKKK
ncbi:MAG: hypothetical protein WCK89_14930 [bacterium]